MTAPLAGIHVLDLTRLLPGAFATLLLADLGADVIKIEDPRGGDYMRWIPPPVRFQAVNRGKRSVVLDVRQPAGHDAFLQMVRQCDVLVEGFRPGTLDRQGLGWDALHEVNPRLIFCALSGYGQTGPRAQRSGHDVNYAALDGLLAGRTAPMPTLAADYSGGYAAALAITAALCGRQNSGQSRFLDVSLAGAALPLLLPRIGVEQLTGALGCYSLYETSDGRFVSVGALESKFFERLVAAVDRPDLAPLHSDATRQEELKRELAGIFRTRTRDEWEAFFREHDACVEPVLEPAEALQRMAGNDPLALMSPLGLCHQNSAAPGYGEHTEQVLSEFGIPAEEIAALRASGAIL